MGLPSVKGSSLSGVWVIGLSCLQLTNVPFLNYDCIHYLVYFGSIIRVSFMRLSISELVAKIGFGMYFEDRANRVC